MSLEPSDILFLIIVLWLLYEILNSGGGGGKRARVPSAA
jgi:hypothetical protein